VAYSAVIIRCPNCNANLETASTVTSVTCAYCGTVSRIQAKTMMFQIPKSLPTTQNAQQRAELLQRIQLQQLRPVRRMSMLFVLLPLLLTFAVVGGGIFFASRAGMGVLSSMSDRTLWGDGPVLLEVDGDGTPDLIGIIRYSMKNDEAHLAAFSGKTGAKLWESESFGNYSALGQRKYGGTGSWLLIGTDRGELSARNAKDGKVAWKLTFDEKIEEMCSGGPNAVTIETADKKWWVVDAKGAKQAAKPLIRLDRDYTDDKARGRFDRAGVEQSDVCVPLGSGWHHPLGTIALQHWHDLADVDGMDVQLLVRKPGGTITVGLGNKKPGTAVPMIAVIDGRKARWTSAIPAVEPLVAGFEDKYFAMTDKVGVVLYKLSNPSRARLTSFDLQSGKRLWDREIPTGTGFVASSLIANGDTVLLGTWQDLRAYSLADGSDRFTVGSSN